MPREEDEPELFETERWGHFSYAIPVAAGHYVATFYCCGYPSPALL